MISRAKLPYQYQLRYCPLRNKLIRKDFSSSTKNDVTKEIASSADKISSLFNIEKSKGLEISKLLSPSARKELSQVNKALSRESVAQTKVGAEASTIMEPSRNDLKIHALTCGIPFIGFGIMDNAILIWAGDQIDTHLGVMFGISTLCAAAIGNIISDIAGVGLGAYIEDFCATRLRLPKVNFSNSQRNLRSVRGAGQLGNVLGLTIGCIIGMFPLLFIDTEEVQHMKKDAYMDDIFNDVVTEAKGLIGAESTCLYLIVDDKNVSRPTPFVPSKDQKEGRYLYAKYETNNIEPTESSGMKEPISKGIVGRVASTGKLASVADVLNDPDYDISLSSFHKTKDDIVKNMLCVPVFDLNGSTIAVIQAINKVEQGVAKKNRGLRRSTISKGFTPTDAKVLQALASHISVALQNMTLGEDASLKEIIKIIKDQGL